MQRWKYNFYSYRFFITFVNNHGFVKNKARERVGFCLKIRKFRDIADQYLISGREGRRGISHNPLFADTVWNVSISIRYARLLGDAPGRDVIAELRIN